MSIEEDLKAATARATAAEQKRDKWWNLLCDTAGALGLLVPETAPHLPGWARKTKERLTAAESALAEAKRDAAQARAANLENSLALAEAKAVCAARILDRRMTELRAAIESGEWYCPECNHLHRPRWGGVCLRHAEPGDCGCKRRVAALACAGEQETPAAKSAMRRVCDNCKRAAKAKDRRTDRGFPIGPCYCDTLNREEKWMATDLRTAAEETFRAAMVMFENLPEGAYEDAPYSSLALAIHELRNALDAKSPTASAGEPASSGQDGVEFDPTLTPEQVQRESDDDEAAALAEEMTGPCPLATPPPGEQGKGGGEGLALVRLVADAFAEEECGSCGNKYMDDSSAEECEPKHTAVQRAISIADAGELEPLAPAQPAEHPASGGEDRCNGILVHDPHVLCSVHDR